MGDLISRQAAIDEIRKCRFVVEAIEKIRALPSAEPERKNGKWTEKHHAYSDEESVIEEWQSCRCSECGRYDTRPYMYYFSEPNYCSYCGADMRGGGIMMYGEDIQKVNEWFDKHTEYYGTSRSEREYSIFSEDLKDFTDFLRNEFPDLCYIRCHLGTGDSTVWFFKEDLENAQFY